LGVIIKTPVQMKKAAIFIWLFIISSNIYAYSWIPFCPDSIQANNICFNVGSWKGLICSDNGMYLWEEDIEAWSFYTYAGLPVTGAAYLDATRILVAMGNGSYSDGVYTFNLETHQFEVVEWMVNPNFMLVVPVMKAQNNKFIDEYYIGTQFSGMYRSVDGLTWTQVPYFNSKSCTAMACFDNHLVVTEVSNIYNIYWSDDDGATWNEAVVPPMITDLKFNYEGELYGIFPSVSNSSGLWYSQDFGQTWDVAFWSDFMSSVGFDAMGTIFVGWDSSGTGYEGIAIYDPDAPPPGLTFLNEGLPNTQINKILLNPSMSAIAIFCCTDQGVWMSYDYMVGEEEHSALWNELNIYPNPFKECIIFDFIMLESAPAILEIYSLSGKKYFQTKISGSLNTQQTFTWNPVSEGLDLSPGIYFIKFTQGKKTVIKKVVYSK
jgi:hypothetical protein